MFIFSFGEYLVISSFLFLMDRQGNQNHILFNIKLVSNKTFCACFTLQQLTMLKVLLGWGFIL